MADSKLTGLTANTTPALPDLLYLVDDPGGTPLSQKIALGDLYNGIALTVTKSAIAATSTDALVLQNTTDAAAGAQQWSPRMRWHGEGWKTNAPAASQEVDWIAELVPVQGAANPTANLIFSASVNGASYLPKLTLYDTTGALVTSTTGSGQVLSLASQYNIANFLVGGSTLSVNLPFITNGGFVQINTGGGNIVVLNGEATGVLALHNGADPYTLRLYGTRTDASNYERASLSHVTGTGVLLAAQTAGTGGDNLDVTITPAGTGNVVFPGGVLLKTGAALTDGAAAAAGTLLNAPTAGDPTKWIPINDNGTTRYIPAW